MLTTAAQIVPPSTRSGTQLFAAPPGEVSFGFAREARLALLRGPRISGFSPDKRSLPSPAGLRGRVALHF